MTTIDRLIAAKVELERQVAELQRRRHDLTLFVMAMNRLTLDHEERLTALERLTVERGALELASVRRRRRPPAKRRR